uniref:Uncharacterized protein n=1 Tax=Araucaria cunninghamii TaxID=56994 RepID=A0A0D6R4T9_ARACU
MASSQLCFTAPKPGLCGGLSTSSSTSCRASNTVLVSNRLRPRSMAVSRRNENGVNMKAGNGIDIGIDGSTQKALVSAQVETESPLQEEEEVNGSPSHKEPCPLQYATPAWSLVSILVGGDMLALLTFCAVGRLSHGLTVLDWDAFRTADPFIAGWLLGAYFLGGYGPDGRGANGFMKAVSVAIKSWAVGIPDPFGWRIFLFYLIWMVHTQRTLLSNQELV